MSKGVGMHEPWSGVVGIPRYLHPLSKESTMPCLL